MLHVPFEAILRREVGQLHDVSDSLEIAEQTSADVRGADDYLGKRAQRRHDSGRAGRDEDDQADVTGACRLPLAIRLSPH